MIEYHKNLSLESLFYINEKGLVCLEEWKGVVDFEDTYKVSNLGRVKSMSRRVLNGKGFISTKTKILKQFLCPDGYLFLTVQAKKVIKKQKVHKLVAMAFLNHVPCGYDIIVDHKNNNPLDNRLENLQLISQLENVRKDKKGIVGLNNVYLEDGRFRGRFWFKRKQYCVGYFDKKEEAKKMVDFVYDKLLKNENVDSYIKTNKNKYYKNISMDNGKYRPRVTINKKRINLPAFEKLEDAIACLKKYRENSTLN